MRERFKLNNAIAILIAIALLLAGFVLSFINKRQVSEQESAAASQVQTTNTRDQAAQVEVTTQTPPAEDDGSDKSPEATHR